MGAHLSVSTLSQHSSNLSTKSSEPVFWFDSHTCCCTCGAVLFCQQGCTNMCGPIRSKTHPKTFSLPPKTRGIYPNRSGHCDGFAKTTSNKLLPPPPPPPTLRFTERSESSALSQTVYSASILQDKTTRENNRRGTKKTVTRQIPVERIREVREDREPYLHV